MTTNYIYRVLPIQVPFFWEAIKFACTTADLVDVSIRPAYFNELLQALLSEKAQCFVVLDEKRILNSIAVTRIVIDRITGDKELHLQCLYSMERMNDSSLVDYWNFIKSFAVSEKCNKLTFNSSNPRVWEIADVIGCTEEYRRFSMEVQYGR
jgi:hypothetical protein